MKKSKFFFNFWNQGSEDIINLSKCYYLENYVHYLIYQVLKILAYPYKAFLNNFATNCIKFCSDFLLIFCFPCADFLICWDSLLCGCCHPFLSTYVHIIYTLKYLLYKVTNQLKNGPIFIFYSILNPLNHIFLNVN